MLKDFKAFIMRGNVMDLAVGVIIGAAFGKIVSSLVADVIMPVIGLILGGINFSGLKLKIGGTETTPVNLAYGNFIQTAIDFLIIAAIIFIMIRLISKLQKPITVSTKSCPRCTMNIALTATRCPYCTSDITV